MNDGYTILIAEDDEDIVSLLSLYLKSSGYRVIAAGNGADALKIVRREKVDLALLDVMMPEMDGYELTRRIRTVSNIPILILSARGQDYDRILGLNLWRAFRQTCAGFMSWGREKGSMQGTGNCRWDSFA